jgi:hypothetical protein
MNNEIEIESKWIENKRLLILDIINKTKKIDLENNEMCLRFYKMTKNEYLISKKYCFKMIFDNTNEAYCYDFRELLNDHYLFFDLKICYLPFLFSGKRWNKAIDIFGDKVQSICKKSLDGSLENGILCWPLYREEKSALFRNYSKNILLKGLVDSYQIQLEDDYFSESYKIYDKSSEERFYPDWQSKKIKEIESITNINPWKTNIENVKKLVLKELVQLELLQICEKRLNSEELDLIAAKCFARGADEIQVFSMYMKDLISSIFKS